MKTDNETELLLKKKSLTLRKNISEKDMNINFQTDFIGNTPFGNSGQGLNKELIKRILVKATKTLK